MNNKYFSSYEVEKELKREIYSSRYIKILKSTVYSLIIIAALSILIATLVMPVLEIKGLSMSPTFKEGDIVLSIKSKRINTGDIIAFYHGNKILIKRVIAGAGSWVNMDDGGNVYIDGVMLEEKYLNEKVLGNYDVSFPYQVPDGHYFVLGDDRKVSIDSRSTEVGSISESDILGKVVFRIWPLTSLGKID